MTNYNFGDVVLVWFIQTGSSERKKRPALVILDINDADVVLVPITTREWTGIGDHKIKDWKISGLLRESWVRLAKISFLEKKDVESCLGKLTILKQI
ncbi:MAG: type II toxin-antitoxin system PemK/MazF family toxin [Planctomycetota bacterium]